MRKKYIYHAVTDKSSQRNLGKTDDYLEYCDKIIIEICHYLKLSSDELTLHTRATQAKMAQIKHAHAGQFVTLGDQISKIKEKEEDVSFMCLF